MSNPELSILVQLKDEASAQLKQLNTELENNKKSWQDNFGAIQGALKTASVELLAFGGAITAALGFAYKSSEEERLSLARLDTTLKNVGVSFDSVSNSIQNNAEATRKATGVSQEEQYEALNQLIQITGDYNKAVSLLPVTLDLAAAKQMDVTQSALLLGRMAEGDINALNRYGFSMDGVKDSAVALDNVQKVVAGSAEAARSPFEVLKTSIGELADAIGNLISPEVTKAIDWISIAVDGITKWAEDNPVIAKWITDIAIAMGVAAIVAGTLTTALVALAIAKTAVTWEIDLIIVAVIALIAYIIIIAIEVYKLETKLRDNTNNIKTFFMNMFNTIIGGFEWWVNKSIDSINIILSAVNGLGKIFGQEWNLKLSKVTFDRIQMADWGIPLPGGATGHGAAAPIQGPPYLNTSGGLTGYGNYGNTGTTYNLGGVTITIEGSNLNADEIAEKVRQEILKLQMRNANSSGITP